MGTAYHGWQTQLNTTITIQSIIESCFSKVLHQKIYINGCGRTDTGVHAKEYYAHFDCNNPTILENTEQFLFRINMTLPNDIAVHDIIPVHAKANARFHALSRTYKYYIHQTKSVELYNRSWFYSHTLDVKLMNAACELLLQNDDFASFCKSRDKIKSSICKLMQAKWEWEGEQLVFTIQANRFLHDMVRCIVAVMLRIGRGIVTLDDFKKLIIAKRRDDAGISAKAVGLYLVKVEYSAKTLLPVVESEKME